MNFTSGVKEQRLKKNLRRKVEVGSYFLGPVDLNTARNSPTANTTQRKGGQDAPVFSVIHGTHARMVIGILHHPLHHRMPYSS